MEPHITKGSVKKYIKDIPTYSFEKVSDFGQEEIRRKEREKIEMLTRKTIYFGEESDKLTYYL